MEAQHTQAETGSQATRLAAAYAKALAQKNELTEKIGALNMEMMSLEESLLSAMLAEGIGDLSVNTDEGRRLRLFPRTETFVQVPPERKGEFVEALKAEGYGELLDTSVHPSRLRSWVKEQQEQGTLPEALAGLMKITQVQKIGTRSL